MCSSDLGDPAWSTVRPPLTELTADQSTKLVDELRKLNFTMPGLKGAGAPTRIAV